MKGGGKFKIILKSIYIEWQQVKSIEIKNREVGASYVKLLRPFLIIKTRKNKKYTYPIYDPQDFVDALKNGFNGEAAEYKINPQEKDLRTIALKLSATNPSVVVMMMFPEQGALFLKEFLRISTSKPIFAFDIASNFQSGSEDYKKILGNLEVLDDSVALTVDDSITEEFKQSYKDRFEIEPGWGADLGFDAFNLLTKTFSVDGKKWINNIKTSEIEGIGGDIIFNENGVRSPSFTIKTIKNGLLE